MSEFTKARDECVLKFQEKALCAGADLDWQESGRKASEVGGFT